jgi:hypothetical protein
LALEQKLDFKQLKGAVAAKTQNGNRKYVVDELRLDAESGGLITVDATVRVAPPVC